MKEMVNHQQKAKKKKKRDMSLFCEIDIIQVLQTARG